MMFMLQTFCEQTGNCFSIDSKGTFEWWTPNTMTELHFSNATLLSLIKHLLSPGQNVFPKNGFVI